MSELYPPNEELLEQLRPFNTVQRCLLVSSGTLQTILSAYFLKPVLVEVVWQERTLYSPPLAEYKREVNLKAGEITVCTAVSHIFTLNEAIQKAVEARVLGLGQIMTVHGIRPSFSITAIGSNDQKFWRTYRLEGNGVSYLITERFPTELYSRFQ